MLKGSLRERPEGRREEPKMTESTKTVETVEIRPTAQSFADYIAARGYSVDAETVELTFQFHAEWQSSPERKAERENARVAKAKAIAEAKAKRDAANKAKLAEEKAKLEAKLAKLSK